MSYKYINLNKSTVPTTDHMVPT